MITKHTAYHYRLSIKKPDHYKIIDEYLIIGDYSLIITKNTKEAKFYDI